MQQCAVKTQLLSSRRTGKQTLNGGKRRLIAAAGCRPAAYEGFAEKRPGSHFTEL
ncbi:hypothetical protein PCASD_07766 [Puccinia coronata f. sp. avenae]|uniref:Uncharacterized protein n=1 Tax=Puccinia coronata f. sp. avenae TaxID=200324 RepID=A0A2N5US48_9BASI|nr:hypothetical protein PCASD_07766 [Puccinia coronata f. sp. avenae]